MEITKKLLEGKYRNMLNHDLCKELNISHPTLVSYLNHFKIKMKKKGNRQKKTKINLIR